MGCSLGLSEIELMRSGAQALSLRSEASTMFVQGINACLMEKD